MTYDPVSHDVLLVGGQHLTGSPLARSPARRPARPDRSSSSVLRRDRRRLDPADQRAAGRSRRAPAVGTSAFRSLRPAADSPTARTRRPGCGTAATGPRPPARRPPSSSASGTWRPIRCPVRPCCSRATRWVAQPDAPIAEPAIACPMQATDTHGATGTPCPVFPIQRPNQSWTVERPGVAGDQEHAEHHRSRILRFVGSSPTPSPGICAMFGNAFLAPTPAPRARPAGQGVTRSPTMRPPAAPGSRSASGTAQPGSRRSHVHEWPDAFQRHLRG